MLGRTLPHCDGKRVDCQAISSQPRASRRYTARYRIRNACAWPLASTRIAERPVTTALGPTTRTSRASGVIDAYRKAPLPTSCNSSARVFWAPSVWVYVRSGARRCASVPVSACTIAANRRSSVARTCRRDALSVCAPATCDNSAHVATSRGERGVIFKRMLGRAMAATESDAHATDDNTDDARPKRDKCEKTRANGIRVRIGPEPKGRCGNDEQQGTGAHDEQRESPLDEPGSEVFAHRVSSLLWSLRHGPSIANPC